MSAGFSSAQWQPPADFGPLLARQQQQLAAATAAAVPQLEDSVLLSRFSQDSPLQRMDYEAPEVALRRLSYTDSLPLQDGFLPLRLGLHPASTANDSLFSRQDRSAYITHVIHFISPISHM